MTSQNEFKEIAKNLLGKIESRKIQINRDIITNESKVVLRQETRAGYVTEKAREVLKTYRFLSDEGQKKEDAINHLVKSMDFINKSDEILKQNFTTESDIQSVKV